MTCATRCAALPRPAPSGGQREPGAGLDLAASSRAHRRMRISLSRPVLPRWTSPTVAKSFSASKVSVGQNAGAMAGRSDGQQRRPSGAARATRPTAILSPAQATDRNPGKNTTAMPLLHSSAIDDATMATVHDAARPAAMPCIACRTRRPDSRQTVAQSAVPFRPIDRVVPGHTGQWLRQFRTRLSRNVEP